MGQNRKHSFGAIAVSENDYQFWTFRQFNNAVSGFYEMQDAKERQDWERVRWSTSVLLNIQLKSNQRIKPEKLLLLPWDNGGKPKAKPKNRNLKIGKNGINKLREYQV